MAPRDLFQQPQRARRSPLAPIVGLLVHSAAAALMWLALLPAAHAFFKHQDFEHQERLTFVRATFPPVEMVRPVRKARPLEIPAPEPPPGPGTIVELRRPLEPAVPEAPPRRSTVPEPPIVKHPVVKVGEFAGMQEPTPGVVQRQVQAVGFEAQPAVAPGSRTRVVDIGTFESQQIKEPRPGTDRPGTVEASGFESEQVRTPGTRTSQTVANSGFGSVPAAPQTEMAVAPRAVKPTGFSDSSPAPAETVRQRTQDPVAPAEVLFKPTPSYSAEARARKIEGTVTLEIEFSAAGQVRVLRVVRGLGYGLDEMAIRAAEQIQFKPALSAGKPVDFIGSVRIIFHLT